MAREFLPYLGILVALSGSAGLIAAYLLQMDDETPEAQQTPQPPEPAQEQDLPKAA